MGKIDYVKVATGSAIFLISLGEPSPFGEMVGLAILADGLGVKI